MKIEIYYTPSILSECEGLSLKEKEAVWQERIIVPFKKMWQLIHVDIDKIGGCDIHTPADVYQSSRKVFEQHHLPERILAAAEKAFKAFQEKGRFPFPKTLKIAVFVSNGKNIFQEKLNHGFSGFGGIPGYVVLVLSPTEYVLKNIEAVVAHEFHHNIRNSIEPWPADMNISVGQYLLIEGMAEAFAAALYGEQAIGPDTRGIVGEKLDKARRIIFPQITEVGFPKAQSLMFGDALADTFGYPKTGLPHAAGYAVGYRLVRDYLSMTGKDIFTATQESTEQILSIYFKKRGTSEKPHHLQSKL